MNTHPGELWRVWPRNPLYMFSSMGRVAGPRGIRKPQLLKGGYLGLVLRVETGMTTILIHREVCILFNGPPPAGKSLALHNNHDKLDCRSTNLHWGSNQDNMDETVAVQRQNTVRGTGVKSAKLSDQQVYDIRAKFDAGATISTLAYEYNVSYQNIRYIVTGRAWKHLLGRDHFK